MSDHERLLRQLKHCADKPMRNLETFPIICAEVHSVLSALSTAPATAEGWRLVPVEPTEDMLDAYWHQCGESAEMRERTHAYGKRYYAAMIAAAPTATGGR